MLEEIVLGYEKSLADECRRLGLSSYLPLVGTALPKRSSPLSAPSSKGVEYRP